MSLPFLNKHSYKVNDKITIHIPTLREIRESAFIDGSNSSENDFYSIVNLFISTPMDCVFLLDKLGIDFRDYNEYDLFILLFHITNIEDLRRNSHFLFENINLANFKLCEDDKGKVYLYDKDNDIKIDRLLYGQLSAIFCTILWHSKPKKFKKIHESYKRELLAKAKERQKNKSSKLEDSFSDLILAMVNNSNFKYDFNSVYDLTIYDFYASSKSILKKNQADNIYHGIYAGTVSYGKIDKKALDWLKLEYNQYEVKSSYQNMSVTKDDK